GLRNELNNSKRGMINLIKKAVEKLEEASASKPIYVISHFDTDGITAAAIFARTLSKLDKHFTLRIVKSLNEDFVEELPSNAFLIFLDLGSGSLEQLAKKGDVLILDHHEIPTEVPGNVTMVNPHLIGHEPVCSAAICYLFSKYLLGANKDLASLAVVGTVGDAHEKEIGKVFSEILEDAEATIKKGLLIYPSTRPVDKVLEYCSNPFIPKVSGNRIGVIELLREAGLAPVDGRYKSLHELDEREMRALITAVMVRLKGKHAEKLIGNIFLVKFFSRMEDARELSALINACSRLGHSDIALGFCLGNSALRKEADIVYTRYRQSLFAALRYFYDSEKIEGKSYMIVNARDKIKDTIIGTVASIASHSPAYEEGFVIVALAYDGERIKVSARVVGRNGRNVRELLARVIDVVGGEVGGHANAAGCIIEKKDERKFIEELRKVLELELVKV
ncbi:DHH family phosphoesterase, partial [Candidatus Pacearchaeota archaeon]